MKSSRFPVTRTLKGNEKQFELAWNSSYGGKFQWNFFQGKGNLVRVSGEFEWFEFELWRLYCNLCCVPRLQVDASEKLRQSGLSHTHPHPVMLTTVRDCPLVPPPPPVQIPRWKLIRQKKKKQPVEPALTPPEPPKDPQFLEVVSPFLNHKVSPIPVSRARCVWPV